MAYYNNNNMGKVGYNDALTEGKWNMGAFIFQQMNDDMIKMAEFKDNNDFMGWFKRFKTLHNKIKATLSYFDSNNKKPVHQDTIRKLDVIRKDFIDTINNYNLSKERNHTTQTKLNFNKIVGLVESLEQEIYSCMPKIGAWLPTKKAFTSWEDELDMDYQ